MRTTLLLIIISAGIVFSQDIAGKEKQFEQIQNEQFFLKNEIDSFNVMLNSILNEVDQHKSQTNPDKKRTAELMAEALSISKEIEKREDQLNQNEDKLLKFKKDLSEYYSNKIAILQKQLNQKNSQAEKESIQQELFDLVNKRIMVSPVINALSFDPAKIKQIDLKTARDSLEKDIYKDYLQTALGIVDSNLSAITKKENELEETKRLEDKADLFAEDVANSRVIGMYEERSSALASESDKNIDNSGGTYTNREAIENTLNQQNDLLVLVHQLQQMGLYIDDQVDRQMLYPDESLTLEEYLELLKKSREFLTLYRRMLQAKINAE